MIYVVISTDSFACSARAKARKHNFEFQVLSLVDPVDSGQLEILARIVGNDIRSDISNLHASISRVVVIIVAGVAIEMEKFRGKRCDFEIEDSGG